MQAVQRVHAVWKAERAAHRGANIDDGKIFVVACGLPGVFRIQVKLGATTLIVVAEEE